MKQNLLLTILLISSLGLSGQEKGKEVSIKLYGFIRNSFYTDTYHGVDASHDQFYLLPLYGGVDENDDEINQSTTSNMTAIATRLGTKVTGPEILGAASSAQIEFDFAGITSSYPSVLRIRQAYMRLAWEKSTITVGQTWHPFWGDASFPHVGALNTGAPFQPFNRSPQIRYDYHLNNGISLLAACLYENQYTSKGFYKIDNDIDKTMPLRYSGTPEVSAMIKYKSKYFNLGVGAEYKTILPINVVSPDNGVTTYTTDNLNNSYGLTAYGNYKKDKLYILVRGVYGQNLTHLTTPGGYGVKSVNATTGEYEYTNYTNYTAFLNITYGKKIVGGLMLGYGGNLGTSEALVNVDGAAKIAGTFTSIQSMSRIAPSVTFNIKNFRFCSEYEMTNAEYGMGSINLSDGLYDATHTITNHRLNLIMMYFF